MEKVALVATGRETGKGVARRLRMVGRIPGVLYGKKVEPVAISVDEIELIKATKKTMNILIDLSLDGGDSGLALIRDYQADPFKRQFKHVDFQAVTLDEKLEIEVPIVLIGKAVGVEEGGVVEQSRRALHIFALPNKIPSEIEIDISKLNIGDNIHASDVDIPEGVEFPYDVDFTLVTVVPPTKVEETVVASEGVEGEEGAEVAEGDKAAEVAEGDKAAEGEADQGDKDKK